MGWRDLIEPTVRELEQRSKLHQPRPTGVDPPLPLDSKDWTWFLQHVDYEAGDLEEMTAEEVLHRFPTTSHSKQPPVNDAKLLTALVWQIWLKAKAGDIDPINGNVRSLWYQYVEDFYRGRNLLPQNSSGGPKAGAADTIIEIMTDCVSKLVYHRIFRYRDELGFTDPIDHKRKIGHGGKPGVLFHTEKEGLWGVCEQLHGRGGHPLAGRPISVMATNGQPSYLSLEYFAKELREREVRELRIGCLCDYDPWGFCIAQSLDEKMRRLGFTVTTWTLTTADLFTQRDISRGQDFTRLLKSKPTTPREQSMRSLIYSWFRITGGIGGKPILLHVDRIPLQKRVARIKEFFERLVEDRDPPAGIPQIRPGKFTKIKKDMANYLKLFAARWPIHPATAEITSSHTNLRAAHDDSHQYVPDIPQAAVEFLDPHADSYD